MSTPRVHYIGLDTPVSPGARGLISKEICAQSAAVQKRSALFCHPSLIPVQSYLADLWYLQHIGTPEVPGGVVNFSSPPTTLLRHKEQPAPSHPPPSLLRWLRHPRGGCAIQAKFAGLHAGILYLIQAMGDRPWKWAEGAGPRRPLAKNLFLVLSSPWLRSGN